MNEPLDAAALLKAFSVLLHDLRTPLGVAHGYARLLREDRLSSEADRARALQGISDALERLTRLSRDASAFVEVDEQPLPLARVAAVEVADHVVRTLGAQLSATDRQQLLDRVCALRSLDMLSESLLALAASLAAGADAPDVRVAGDATELLVLMGSTADRPRLLEGARPAFDPWRAGHALSLARASHQLARNGGAVWALDSHRALAVALPLEGAAR